MLLKCTVLEEVDSGSITYKDAKSIQLEDTERPDDDVREIKIMKCQI